MELTRLSSPFLKRLAVADVFFMVCVLLLCRCPLASPLMISPVTALTVIPNEPRRFGLNLVFGAVDVEASGLNVTFWRA